MHQIPFRLRLRRRPRWESLQRSPDLLSRFQGLLLREMEAREEYIGEGRGGEEKELKGKKEMARKGRVRNRGTSEGRGWEGKRGNEEWERREKGRFPLSFNGTHHATATGFSTHSGTARQCRAATQPVADLERDRAGSAPPPFQRRTDAVSLKVLPICDNGRPYCISATSLSFHACKTWYSEYSK